MPSASMSAFGYKRTYSRQLANVRFTPNSGHWHVARKCSRWRDGEAARAPLEPTCQGYLRRRFLLS